MCIMLVSCNLKRSKKDLIMDGMNMVCQYDVIVKEVKLIPSCVKY